MRMYGILFLLLFVSWGCGVGPHLPLPIAPTPSAQPQPGPEAEGTVSMQTHTYSKDVGMIIQQNCAMCHNQSSPPAMPNWLDYNVAFMKKENIYDRVWVKRNMPPQGMPEEQRKIIADWVQQGAPK